MLFQEKLARTLPLDTLRKEYDKEPEPRKTLSASWIRVIVCMEKHPEKKYLWKRGKQKIRVCSTIYIFFNANLSK